MAYIGSKPTNLRTKDREVFTYTSPSTGTTTFSGNDDTSRRLVYNLANNDAVEVYVNGVWLPAADYTATSGTSVVLATGTFAGDIVTIVTYNVVPYNDTVSKTTGGTFTGDITVQGKLNVSGADPEIFLTDTTTGVDHSLDGNSGLGNLYVHVDKNNEGSAPNLITTMQGSEVMRIDSDGNIGLGVTNPDRPLSIKGNADASFTGTGKGSGIMIAPPSSATGYVSLLETNYSNGYNSGTATAKIAAYNNPSSGTNLHFGTSNNWAAGVTNDAMVIDYQGSVDIPSQPFGAAIGTVGSTASFANNVILDYFQQSVARGGMSFSNGGRWTVPKTGLYFVHGRIYTYINSGTAMHVALYVLKNGTTTVTFNQDERSAAETSYSGRMDRNMQITGVIDLAANDYLELQVVLSGSNLDIYRGTAHNNFIVYKLS